MSLNDVALLHVKQNKDSRKKTKKSSSYQNNTYRELDHTDNICFLFTRQPKRWMQTCQLQHLKQFNRLKTCFTDLSKIQSHCNNKTTSTCPVILTSIMREIIMYRVMFFLPHTTQSMKISLFYLPFPLLMQFHFLKIKMANGS